MDPSSDRREEEYPLACPRLSITLGGAGSPCSRPHGGITSTLSILSPMLLGSEGGLDNPPLVVGSRAAPLIWLVVEWNGRWLPALALASIATQDGLGFSTKNWWPEAPKQHSK